MWKAYMSAPGRRRRAIRKIQKRKTAQRADAWKGREKTRMCTQEMGWVGSEGPYQVRYAELMTAKGQRRAGSGVVDLQVYFSRIGPSTASGTQNSAPRRDLGTNCFPRMLVQRREATRWNATRCMLLSPLAHPAMRPAQRQAPSSTTWRTEAPISGARGTFRAWCVIASLRPGSALAGRFVCGGQRAVGDGSGMERFRTGSGRFSSGRGPWASYAEWYSGGLWACCLWWWYP